ncbi:MAG: hypothetical protein NC344_05660 [Bacteroidales bacterium]|nr:hypothetical protein [Bacteroidales bacterium]MCM1147306.1 hypothetical protein [Bacteroidales bacterium]MCM1206260.1 hypothetical protein [Bacillota bacterium]
MSCCEKENRITVMLSFKRDELLYDAGNYSYVEGDIMKAEEEHARHQVFDIVQDGNVDRVTRVLNLAHLECVEMLFPYTKNEIQSDGCMLDDKLTEPESYDITLLLPKYFSMTTVQLLKDLIHEYLVCRVLADWMSITNPSSQKNWEEKIDYLKTKINTSLVSRRGKIRRKMKPF